MFSPQNVVHKLHKKIKAHNLLNYRIKTEVLKDKSKKKNSMTMFLHSVGIVFRKFPKHSVAQTFHHIG